MTAFRFALSASTTRCGLWMVAFTISASISVFWTTRVETSASVDAALRVVDKLQAQGYQFVTVQELLEHKGVSPEPGVMYYSDHKWG